MYFEKADLDSHCVKPVHIQSYSGPHFPAFGLNTERYGVSPPYLVRMREDVDQNNSEYGQFLRRVCQKRFSRIAESIRILLS